MDTLERCMDTAKSLLTACVLFWQAASLGSSRASRNGSASTSSVATPVTSRSSTPHRSKTGSSHSTPRAPLLSVRKSNAPRTMPLRSTPQPQQHTRQDALARSPNSDSESTAAGSRMTPRAGSTQSSGRATPWSGSDMSESEKDQELMEAYRRIARLQVENEKLRAAMSCQNSLVI